MIQNTEKGFKVITEVGETIDKIGEAIDKVIYWLNPVHIWQGLGTLVNSSTTAVFLMAGTIIGFWFIAFGAKTPKKVIFWSWVSYWLLRGFVFV